MSFLSDALEAAPPVEVLFEPEGVRWDPTPSREKRKELAAAAGRGPACAGFKYSAGSGASSVGFEEENSNTLSANPGMKQTTYVCETGHTGANGLGAGESDIYKTLGTSCDGAVACIADATSKAAIDRDMCGSLKVGGAPPMVAKTLLVRCGKEGGGKGALVSEDVSLTLATANAQALFPGGPSVRRLTPRECERLQGFPDDWTKIPYRGKPADECPDGPRYKAIGNSMAVPVMRWIFKRIEAADNG